MEQLSAGGRLVLPLELHRYQRGQVSLALVKREGYLESVSVAGAYFIPLRGGQAMNAERFAPLSVISGQEKEHRWELNVYGAPLMTSPGLRRDVLHLLSGPYEIHELHLDGPARNLLTYLELRYGEREAIFAWSSKAIWGFEGWAGGVLVHPLREPGSGLTFPPFSGRSSQQAGLALLRAATDAPDDAGLNQIILYGNSAARRQLYTIAREWKRLHYPALTALHVRAYPQGTAPPPAEDEWLITKRSVQLILSFHQEPPTST